MYALVLLDLSPNTIDKLGLMRFLESIENNDLQKTKNTRIFDSAWLIDLNNGLPFFRNILDAAQDHKVPCKVSFFEHKLEFSK
jgi:hypothetical protein